MLLFDDPVVSAASKHAQPAREAPSAVSVITREEIRRYGFRTLAEALRTVRGFYGSYDRNYDAIGVRGFLRPGDYNDRILLLVNGHTYNDDAYQTAHLGTDFGVDLEAVQRIEVIRGPGAALYGGNALFAVVNVVTIDAADADGVRPLLETGSFGRKRGQISFGHTFDAGPAVFASGSVLDVDGDRALFYPAYDAPQTNRGIARDADGDRALNFFLSARYGGFQLQGGANSREKQIPTASYGTTFDDPGSKTVDGRRFADLTYTSAPLWGTVVTARAYFDGARYHGTYIYGGGAGRSKNEDLASSDWLGSELRGRRELFHDNTLTVGAEYTFHPSVLQENFDLPSHRSLLHDRRSYSSFGAYAQDEWALCPKFTLVTGLRYDEYYGRIEQLSPRVATVWRPDESTTVKLLYGRAFRAPNLYERYYALYDPTGSTLRNPTLDPERITTYEATLERQLWEGATGSFTLYHNDISDLIDQVDVTGPGGVPATQFRNGPRAYSQGGEVEFRVTLPYGVLGRASYSLQETRSQGHLLSNSPKHLGAASVLFPLVLGFRGGAQLLIVGPRETGAGRRLETAPVASLTLEYKTPLLPGLDISASGYNLLNRTYPDPSGPEILGDRVPQDGITWRLQVRYAF